MSPSKARAGYEARLTRVVDHIDIHLPLKVL